MILDKIILRLTEPLSSQEDAVVLGRMGFLEWLVCVPEDRNFTEQAELAYARAAPLKAAVPAISVLCDLLQAAVHNCEESKELPGRKTAVDRRYDGSQQQRRTLH